MQLKQAARSYYLLVEWRLVSVDKIFESQIGNESWMLNSRDKSEQKY